MSTSDLGTFETNCYYFGVNSSYRWDDAWRTCTDLGGLLVVIESNAEFKWIMQVYQTMYSNVTGLYVDATRARYGSSFLTPAWRGGASLQNSTGITFNQYNATPQFTSVCYFSCTLSNSLIYLTPTGDLADIWERNIIPGTAGFICKKYQTTFQQPRIAYNIGTCFPSLASTNICPSGWQNYNVNNSQFCYYNLGDYYAGWDEKYRECHQLGADMVYLQSSTEWTWMGSANIYDSAICFQLNGHKFRYGLFSQHEYWSTGVSADVNYGIYSGYNSGWCIGQPDDWCQNDNALQLWGACYNDIATNQEDKPSLVNSYWNGHSACKRPLCGRFLL